MTNCSCTSSNVYVWSFFSRIDPLTEWPQRRTAGFSTTDLIISTFMGILQYVFGAFLSSPTPSSPWGHSIIPSFPTYWSSSSSWPTEVTVVAKNWRITEDGGGGSFGTKCTGGGLPGASVNDEDVGVVGWWHCECVFVGFPSKRISSADVTRPTPNCQSSEFILVNYSARMVLSNCMRIIYRHYSFLHAHTPLQKKVMLGYL